MSSKYFEPTQIKTKEEARQKAIDWQSWSSEQDMSWEALAVWQGYFERMAKQFNLVEEFRENGII